MRRRMRLPAIGLLVIALAGPALGAPLTVTDALGRQVTVSRPPRRIISVAPSITETLFALGLGARVVGVSAADDYPPDQVRSKPRVGGVQLDVERIVALRPDLILGVASLQAAQLHRLTALGLPVVAVDAASLPQTYAQIRLIGRLTGREVQAAALVARMQGQELAVLRAVAGRPRPRTYVEIWGEPLMTAGGGTFLHDLIGRAGGQNIFADLAGWPQVSAEAVVRRDPQVIVLLHPHRAQVLGRRGWAQVAAVRSGRVVSMDAATLSRPGPRIVQGLAALARVLHPEAF